MPLDLHNPKQSVRIIEDASLTGLCEVRKMLRQSILFCQSMLLILLEKPPDALFRG